MNEIHNILNSISKVQVAGEDENTLSVTLRSGATELQLNNYEKELHVKLPKDFKDLYSFSNGLDFFGLDILSLNEQEFFSPPGIITFHNWGNGDFDCIASGSKTYADGTILFMNHNPGRLVPISMTLTSWIASIFEEIKIKGALLHPADYYNRKEKGMYCQALTYLKNKSWELIY